MFRIKSRLSQGVSFPLGTFNAKGQEQFLELPAGAYEATVDTLPENVEAAMRGIYAGQIEIEGGPSRPRPQGGAPLTPEEADAQIAAIRARVVDPEDQRTGTSPIKGTPHDPHLRPALTEADSLADLRGEPRPDNPSVRSAQTPPAKPSETAQRAAEQQRAEKAKEAAATGEPKKP